MSEKFHDPPRSEQVVIDELVAAVEAGDSESKLRLATDLLNGYWLLCGLRTGMRAGELLALQWGDIDWRGSFIHLERNLVRGVLTTPFTSHQSCLDFEIRYSTRCATYSRT